MESIDDSDCFLPSKLFGATQEQTPCFAPPPDVKHHIEVSQGDASFYAWDMQTTSDVEMGDEPDEEM